MTQSRRHRDLAEQPRRLAVLGGGPVGCELAQAFARLYPTRSEYLRRIADEYQQTRLTPWMRRALRWWVRRADGAIA